MLQKISQKKGTILGALQHKINISTYWDVSKSPSDVISALIECSFLRNFEITNGLNKSDEFELLSNLRNAYDLNLILHNYCLNTADEFVLNLAEPKYSNNRRLSIDLIKRNIVRSQMFNSKYYAIHAGFLLKLLPDDLGQTASRRKLIPNGVDNFIEACHELSKFAKKYGVKLLIENNVLTSEVFNNFDRRSPFMCVCPESTHDLMATLSKCNIGLLLDWGHLKVSANTMGFSPEDFIQKNSQFINGLHISENDGKIDKNESLDSGSDFFKQDFPKVEYVTLEIKKTPPERLFEQIILIEEKLNE